MRIWKIDETQYTFPKGKEMEVYRTYHLFTSKKKAMKHAEFWSNWNVEKALKEGRYAELDGVNRSISEAFVLLITKFEEVTEDDSRMITEFVLTDKEVL